jgi:hypothetical protein
MSRICSAPLSLLFTDKVSQYRQRTRLLGHWPVWSFISIITEGEADGDEN